jgi:hypothetical protein
MGRSNEQLVQNSIRAALGRGPVRLFRNNTGALKDESGRLVRFGLAPGSSDLIGWRTVEVTEDMVGSSIAVFTAIEVKDRGRPTPQQLNFLEAVTNAGGIAGVARSIEEAHRILFDL